MPCSQSVVRWGVLMGSERENENLPERSDLLIAFHQQCLCRWPHTLPHGTDHTHPWHLPHSFLLSGPQGCGCRSCRATMIILLRAPGGSWLCLLYPSPHVALASAETSHKGSHMPSPMSCVKVSTPALPGPQRCRACSIHLQQRSCIQS